MINLSEPFPTALIDILLTLLIPYLYMHNLYNLKMFTQHYDRKILFFLLIEM
jgi:hypothetical protein